MSQGIRTGRTEIIYAHLRATKRPLSATEVRDAVLPDDPLDKVSSALSKMAQRGQAMRTGSGWGNVRFRAGTTPPSSVTLRLRAERVADARKPAPPRAPRKRATNFNAAPGTVEYHADPKRAASAQIAADVDAFLANGGRVQVLGITRLFHTPRGQSAED